MFLESKGTYSEQRRQMQIQAHVNKDNAGPCYSHFIKRIPALLFSLFTCRSAISKVVLLLSLLFFLILGSLWRSPPSFLMCFEPGNCAFSLSSKVVGDPSVFEKDSLTLGWALCFGCQELFLICFGNTRLLWSEEKQLGGMYNAQCIFPSQEISASMFFLSKKAMWFP